jgi:anaerobic ribonucleoside-triphosphate reductase activating protein
MNYSAIKNYDIANGLGVRVTLFVSGCTHHCEGCFNEETWSFSSGKPFTKETEDEIIKLLSPDYIKGLTLLGGEPMEKVNQAALYPFVKRVKEAYPDKNIWCYSGYTLDEITKGRAHTDVTDALLGFIDVLVDGEFKKELYSIALKFRGSSNQRVIDLKETLKQGKTVLLLE